MGSWGVAAFENDSACDWSYGLEQVNDLSLLQATLDAVLRDVDEYLDSSMAQEGLAACEVIARLKGRWGLRTSHSEAADKWVEAHALTPPTRLVQQTLLVIDRVLSPPSELFDLWEESESADQWQRSVKDLKDRLRS